MGMDGRRLWVGAAALMAVALVVAACGGGDASLGSVVTSGVATTSGGNVTTFLSGEGVGAASFEASGGLTVIDLGHVGDGPFQVMLRGPDSDGAPETLVEQVGAWGGTVGLGLASGRYRLDVVADGVWFADVRELRDEPAINSGGYEGNRETFGRWEEKSTPVADEARVNGEYLFGGGALERDAAGRVVGRGQRGLHVWRGVAVWGAIGGRVR